ncbi:hypothetical protein AAG906_040530 [Vitis piasezkii]
MALKATSFTSTLHPSLCSVSSLFLFTLISILSVSLFFLFTTANQSKSISSQSLISQTTPQASIKVYVADLPRSLNYGLLDTYWSLQSDSRLGSEADREIRRTQMGKTLKFPPAEYWIMGDLMTPEKLRYGSFAKRAEAGDGVCQGTEAWKRSGGRDHVFVLTDPVAMWHVKAEIAPVILLVVDFLGWYKLDSKESNNSLSEMIQYTQVSLLKDVIVPYTHLLPRLHLSENQKRRTFLYFKGAKHRHRGGLVREKLWDLLVNEQGVIMEEGFPNATVLLAPCWGHPYFLPTFDAIQSLCIPVIVSDNIELPFEGMVDYSEFSVFVAVRDSLLPNWLVSHLRSFSKGQRDRFRQNMALVQPIFQYDNGHPSGIGPIPPDGAVNHIWKKVHQKLPMIKEAIIREKRKPPGASVPLRCLCT